MYPPRLMPRRSVPSISPCERPSMSFTFVLLMAAFTSSAVATPTVPAFTVNAATVGAGTAVLVASVLAVHVVQPPFNRATLA